MPVTTKINYQSSSLPSKKTAPPTLRKTSKVPSIKDIESISNQEVAGSSSVANIEEPRVEMRKKSFGLQDLKKYWQDFADQKKVEGKATDHVLLNEDITLLENYVIEIKLSNPVQEEFLNSLRTELIIFLRGKLENDYITITSALRTEAEKRRPYTPKEKLEHMMEKQPLLQELKERLGLDPDF
ncbi:hypothetical protein BH23BAC1_BH23BAC1_33520 [soil metagenome]